jgi:uncharacterized membrane protein YebE (DUF533 family)
MNPTVNAPVTFSSEELALLAELIASERTKLLIEIRHTDHRSYRDQLSRRLELLEALAKHIPPA